MDLVKTVLRDLGLEAYRPLFERHHIDDEILTELTAEDLREIGIDSLGHRKRILRAIAAAGATQEPADAVPADSAGDEPEAKPQTTDEEQDDAGAERREVTTVFADLTGYARLSEDLDPEDLHAVKAAFYERFDAIVRRMGGTVERHIGDCVMAVFGAPVSHGNDAERALRASLEMHSAMEELSARFGRDLSVHIGVAAGNVLFSPKGYGVRRDAEFTLNGESVNLASRLSDAAKGGETLLTDEVYRALSERIRCDASEELEVRGFSRPVRVHRLIGFGDVQLEGPFVGRSVEMAALGQALSDCRQAGRGQTIQIVGEAGMGKSRLAEEVSSLARERGFEVQKALVLDFGLGEAQNPVSSLLAQLCGLDTRAQPSAVRAVAGSLSTRGVLDQNTALFFKTMLGAPLEHQERMLHDAMSDSARRRGRADALAQMVRDAAAQRPLVLIVEDVHWADAETLAQIAILSAETARAPILLLVTSRLENEPDDAEWQGATAERSVRRIELSPLHAADAQRLVVSAYEPPAAVLEECVRRAEGNPLFLEQLLRHQREQGHAAIPGSIQSLVQARLDRLSQTDRRVLQAAAVLGQRFSMEAVIAVAGIDVYDETPLIDASLIRRVRDGRLFAHALIRDSVLQTILRTDLKTLHRAAARWFEGSDTVLYAEHLAAAGEPGAAEAFLAAARDARAAYHKDTALSLTERGLAVAEAAEVQGWLLCLRGDLLRDLGHLDEAVEALESARALAETPVDLARARIGIVAVMRIMDRIDEAYALLDEAEADAEAAGLEAELSEIHYFRGSLHFPRGNLEGCLAEHLKSLDYAERCNLPERRALALSGLGDAHYAGARIFTAHRVIEDCLAVCEAHGLGAVEAGNRFMLATVKIYMNETETALDEALRSAELAAQVGQARAEIVSRLTAGWILASMARTGPARAEIEQGLAVAGRLGARRFEPFLEESMARIQRLEGDAGAAHRTAEAALAKLRQLEAMHFIGPWLLATVALTAGAAPRRRAALDEGEALLARGCVGHNYLRFYRYAMEACLEAREWAEARRHADSLEAYTAEEPTPWTDFFIARTRALADAGEGRADPLRLAELRDKAERARLFAAIPAIDQAREPEGATPAGE